MRQYTVLPLPKDYKHPKTGVKHTGPCWGIYHNESLVCIEKDERRAWKILIAYGAVNGEEYEAGFNAAKTGTDFLDNPSEDFITGFIIGLQDMIIDFNKAKEYKQGHDDCVAGTTPPHDATVSYLNGYARTGARLEV